MEKQSRNSVKIVGRQWSLVLPAGQGYDREVLLDHLTEAVQRHGNAELVSHNGNFSIARTAEQSTSTCDACGTAAGQMAGRSGGSLLCLPCILRRMYGRARTASASGSAAADPDKGPRRRRRLHQVTAAKAGVHLVAR